MKSTTAPSRSVGEMGTFHVSRGNSRSSEAEFSLHHVPDLGTDLEYMCIWILGSTSDSSETFQHLIQFSSRLVFSRPSMRVEKRSGYQRWYFVVFLLSRTSGGCNKLRLITHELIHACTKLSFPNISFHICM